MIKHKLARLILLFIYFIVLLHFLKDIAQDLLKISTPLDLLGDTQEDLARFPVLIKSLFLVAGILTYFIEAALLALIPYFFVTKSKQVEKVVFCS